MILTTKLPDLDLTQYTSKAQKIRNLTESYVVKHIFCPICGNQLIQHPNNHPCGDFYCKNCLEDYELKSKKDRFGNKIVDGEYNKMIQKIDSETPSNFFFLAYRDHEIIDFFTIPKFFFTPSIIEKRNPLSENARRAGWVGCNILYNRLPDSAKIFYIKNGEILKQKSILENYQRVVFVSQNPLENKGWLLDIMFCIESLHREFFTLEDLYSYTDFLRKNHPDNNHIKDKIRQQLQLLRDKGFIEFVKRGNYRIVNKIL